MDPFDGPPLIDVSTILNVCWDEKPLRLPDLSAARASRVWSPSLSVKVVTPGVHATGEPPSIRHWASTGSFQTIETVIVRSRTSEYDAVTKVSSPGEATSSNVTTGEKLESPKSADCSTQ